MMEGTQPQRRNAGGCRSIGPILICAIFSMIGIKKMTALTKQFGSPGSDMDYGYEVKRGNADGDDDVQDIATSGQICLENVSSRTITNRTIPNVIHFIVQSKCLSKEIAIAHTHNWEAIDQHSIMYHDQRSIDAYMSRARKDFPAAAATYKCALDPLAKMDLAKLMILWDHGGIAVDIGHVMGPAFQNGKLIQDRDECIFEVDDQLAVNPRFLACKPKHAALYAAIVRFITMPFVDYTSTFPYTLEKRNDVIGFARTFLTGFNSDDGNITIRGLFEGDEIAQINTTAINGELFTSLPMNNDTRNEIRLGLIPKEDQEQCKAILRNDSYALDIKSLLDLVGYGTENVTCREGLKFIGSKFDERSILEGRKIPKILHMTSKSHCFADEFVETISKWSFKDYSTFMHDDVAVDRLLSREWPEFPLLQEVRSCINTGAGMADLWRYLVIWEYGGIYTDIDNAPGPLFQNGTIILNDMDSFFEVDGMGGFPSQYFFAASPHHPVAYNMVQHAISRLLEVSNIGYYGVHFVTGPAATKCGVLSTINNGYPKEGFYTGLFNRTINVRGDRRRKPKERQYIHRSITVNKKHVYSSMDMLHYSKQMSKNQRNQYKPHSCLHEIYQHFKIRD